jgi:uridine kinase
MHEPSDLFKSSTYIEAILTKKHFTLQNKDLPLHETAKELQTLLLEQAKHFPSPFIVSLIAGAAAGKGMITRKLQSLMPDLLVIDVDNYLKGDRVFRRQLEQHADPLVKYNPELLQQDLESLIHMKEGDVVKLPKKVEPNGEALTKEGILSKEPERQQLITTKPSMILVMGDFQFITPHYCVYLHMSDEERLASRIERDSMSRNSDPDEVKRNFLFRQEKQHFPFTLPQVENAHLIIRAKKQEDHYLHDMFTLVR